MKSIHTLRAALVMAFFLSFGATHVLFAQSATLPSMPPGKSLFLLIPEAQAQTGAQLASTTPAVAPGKSYFVGLPALRAGAQPVQQQVAYHPAPPGKSLFTSIPTASHAMRAAAARYATAPGKSLFVAMPSGATRQAEATIVQTIAIEAGTQGYVPSQVELQAGTPVQLVFTRTVDSACMSQVQVPAFGIEKTDLPLNEAVTLTITPTETGTFTFACGMDMHQGTLLVRSF